MTTLLIHTRLGVSTINFNKGNKMNEKPILFNADMVKAILDGRKTQTRRMVKNCIGDGSRENPLRMDLMKCPFGKVGDQLYVRETHAIYQTINHVCRQSGASFSEVSDGCVGYKADGHESINDFKEHVRLMSGSDFEGIEVKKDQWLPSIHMPRWASRIQLEITDVRVERLNDITEDDARAEGFKDYLRVETPEIYYQATAKQLFLSLWEKIYKNRDQNPWVWVVEFKVLR